ncbi:hypothetical protein PIB30_037694 [Stylosanthes scabra]|uniref:Uncharacterized protein n=1 Tax=Stylosanthes scabra TaxID=79078 RepID=A0ABU6XDY3_9FABA|nr:hypothetical protein [Stylosanthes scabra]
MGAEAGRASIASHCLKPLFSHDALNPYSFMLHYLPIIAAPKNNQRISVALLAPAPSSSSLSQSLRLPLSSRSPPTIMSPLPAFVVSSKLLPSSPDLVLDYVVTSHGG